MLLGQIRRDEGNLLALAFSLSSLSSIPKDARVKIHLNSEMNKSRGYSHTLDSSVVETKEFLKSIEERFKGRVEYVV
jgi:hypothetical protein